MHLFSKFPQNALKVFSGYNLLWHALAIGLTVALVASDLDWRWFTLFPHNRIYESFFFGAGILGFILPVFVPLLMLIKGALNKNSALMHHAWAVGQSALLGLLVSWIYKAVTGRAGPEVLTLNPTKDITKVFHFGFLRGGVLWGWPSSHTLVAVATATTLIMMYPKSRLIRILAVLTASYITFGAAIGFHWLSDCVAGLIIGLVVGITVGRAFQKGTKQLS